ncbi:MAG: hypothetical protein J6T15_03855 [Bacilli bacterium]|nr:hypothetical protein [Bacilli bacterium]
MDTKVYTGYDVECMIYLSLQIMKYLDLEKRWLLIDLYQQEIVKIYEDYKKYDDLDVSLLDSINNYIEKNADTLRARINKAFEGMF